MAELRREIAEYGDFVLLDIEEEYSKLPYKILAFFKAAYALYDSAAAAATSLTTTMAVQINSG
nr:probable beta-1,3-galactosyltransferase 13 isoform X2 [Ipomoea trifida]